jgi:hypothetical protein
MQQSLFDEGGQSADERLVRAVDAAELRWRKTAQAAVGMAALAIVLGLISVIIAFAYAR